MKKFNLLLEQILCEGTAEEQVIKQAMIDKHPIKFKYDGTDRTVEPYIFGHSLRNNMILRAYQTEGPTPTGWRTFKIDKMTEISPLTDKTFEMRSDYTGSDKKMRDIVYQLLRKQ